MAIVVRKEMGLTHREFFRTFATLVGDQTWQVADDVVTLDDTCGPVTIHLAPEGQRTIALVSLPVTTLRFEFAKHDAVAVDAFMQRFDRCFRRGGG